MLAHPYFRYSHPDQQLGASIERQRDDITAHIGAKGWKLGDEYIDEARSASKSRHRQEGAELHRFEEEARAGAHNGKILVVEKLDRLSRRGHDDTYELIKSLGRFGVHIATVDGDMFFQAGKPLDMFQVMTILIKAEAAREEVVKKGERVKDSHTRRRARAASEGTALGKLAPYWLRVDEKTNRYVVIEERANLVRRIFNMSDEGKGAMTIAKTLNAEKVAVWQRWAKRPVRAWDRTRICKILSDEAVLGWRKSSVDEPMKIYPPIIAADLFERLRAAAPTKLATKGGGRSKECANLVSGIATCHKCGAKMMYHRVHAWNRPYITKAGNEARLKHHAAYLVCRAAAHGACENKKTTAYHSFEKALLDAALHIALDDRAFVKSEELAKVNQLLAEKEQDLRRAQEKAGRLWEAWADNDASDLRRDLAEKAENEAKALQVDVDNLTKARGIAAGKVSQSEHIGRIADVRRRMEDRDFETRATARKKAMEGFRSVVTDIWFDNGVATVAFAGGLAALQISKGKIIAQASAVCMFTDRDFRALPAPAAMASNVYDRITGALSAVDRMTIPAKHRMNEMTNSIRRGVS